MADAEDGHPEVRTAPWVALSECQPTQGPPVDFVGLLVEVDLFLGEVSRLMPRARITA